MNETRNGKHQDKEKEIAEVSDANGHLSSVWPNRPRIVGIAGILEEAREEPIWQRL